MLRGEGPRSHKEGGELKDPPGAYKGPRVEVRGQHPEQLSQGEL